MPEVSVITPCHRAEAFIGRTIASVRAQTFTDWEHIVVDDGSPDRSAEIVAAEATRDSRLRLYQQPHRGVCRARNRGVAAAAPDSRYLLFLDADDVLEPTMLARMVSYLDQHPAVGMAFCEPRWIDADDRPVVYGSPGGDRFVPAGLAARRLAAQDAETPFISIFLWNRITPSISVLRRSVYEATGGWNEDQGFGWEDPELFLRIALRSTIHYVPEQLARRRLHPDQHGRDPSLRLDSQARKMYARWLRGDGLTTEERRMVAAAWQFRQGRFLPYLWLRWGGGHLRRGELAHALTCYLRSLRRVGLYVSARLRRQIPAGPIW